MFKLEAKPVFSAEVSIPIPGCAPEKVMFQFRHSTREQFDAFADAIRNEEKTVDDVVREVVAGWTAPGVEFTPENLNT